jgi:hypothetical protein
MQITTETQDQSRARNRAVAGSFYRKLRAEGFTHQQIIELSTTLLDFVTEDLKEQAEPEAK